MTNLNNINQIKKLDKSNLLDSIELLGKQCEEAWQEIKKIKIPKNYQHVQNVIISGMGGSSLGAHVIKTLFRNQLKVPVELVRDYTLLNYVGPKTLLILSSYSGNTEEPIFTAYQGLKKKTKIIGLASGGKLAKFLKKNHLPAYIFTPKYNPSNQPRMGLGYSVLGQLGLLKQCGLLKIKDEEIKEMIKFLKIKNRQLGIKNKNSIAKKIATSLKGKIPILVASEFLIGNAHAFANQINENAKCFSAYFVLPELNHHLMEGFKNPTGNSKTLKFVLINSHLYHPRNQERYKVLKEILRKNKIEFVEYKPTAKTKFLQSFETLLLGSYVSFYLAMLYNLDPSPIPWVDFFKKRLG